MVLNWGPFDVVHEIAPASQTEFASDDLAIAIQEKRGGQKAQATIALLNRFVANQDGVVDAHFRREFDDVFGTN